MKLIICVDEQFGVSFDKKRQSKDRALCKRIAELAQDFVLRMNQYSAKMFREYDIAQIEADEDFLKRAKTGEFCFVEQGDGAEYLNQAEEIIIFQWNRHYPADCYFPIDDLGEYECYFKEDFVGYSHEKITEERYRRCRK